MKTYTFQINLQNGSTLPLELSCGLHLNSNETIQTKQRVFGEDFEVKHEGGNWIVAIQPASWNRIKRELIAAIPVFAAAIPKMNSKQPLGLRISDAEKARFDQFLSDSTALHQAQADANKQARLNAEASAPRKYAILDSVTIGDYNITEDRYVALMRKNLRAEGWVVVEIVARFDDKIGQWKGEWDALKSRPILTGDFREISETEACKWITRAGELKTAEATENNRKEAAYKDATQRRESERAARFEEARRTGKPVLLGKHFLSGSDIPRQYREEDSDMGHLCVFAMPDGSTKEEFSHAY